MALGFSGSTSEAYPLVLQLTAAVAAFRPAVEGSLEFTYLIEHLGRVVNDMLGRIHTDPAVRGAADPTAFATRGDVLLVGGYSRHVNGLILRALQYDRAAGVWKFTRARARAAIGAAKIFRVFGDRTAASRFSFLLREHLAARGKVGNAKPLDLEPLEVLWRFLGCSESSSRPLPLDRRPPTVGGSPQIVHVFPGGQATPLAVRWDSGAEIREYLLGRRAMAYEHLDVPLVEFDPSEWRLRVRPRGQWSPAAPAVDAETRARSGR
jgi:hypothetical protein